MGRTFNMILRKIDDWLDKKMIMSIRRYLIGDILFVAIMTLIWRIILR